MALQIACQFARDGLKTVLFAGEEPQEDLIGTGEGLGFGPLELIHENILQITDLARQADATTIVKGDYDVVGMGHQVEVAVKKFEGKAMVLDSVTALFSPNPSEDRLRSHFAHLIHTFRKYDLASVVTAEAPADYAFRTTLGVEDYVCDAVIILRNLIDDERRRRSIEVHKYRRSAHQKASIPAYSDRKD